MTISLGALVGIVTRDVPQRNGVPGLEQVIQKVKDATAEVSRRAGLVKVATLTMVPGQATYNLPADFVKMIQLESPASPDGVIVSGQGLIPVSAGWQERWTIAAGRITFYPTPAYSLARDLEYRAGYVLDDEEMYPDMSEDVAALVRLKAQAECLHLQATDASKEAWQYQIGDERVSKERLAGELRAQADALEKQYEKALAAHVGTVGLRAEY